MIEIKSQQQQHCTSCPFKILHAQLVRKTPWEQISYIHTPERPSWSRSETPTSPGALMCGHERIKGAEKSQGGNCRNSAVVGELHWFGFTCSWFFLLRTDKIICWSKQTHSLHVLGRSPILFTSSIWKAGQALNQILLYVPAVGKTITRIPKSSGKRGASRRRFCFSRGRLRIQWRRHSQKMFTSVLRSPGMIE